jgi:hypothetical protein
MRMRREERIQYGFTYIKPKRHCLTCHKVLDRQNKYCDWKCNPKQNKHCKYDDCERPKLFNKHTCEYHTKKNIHKRKLNEIKKCNDCGCDIGKRKDNKYVKFCKKCNKIKKKESNKRQTEYRKNYYKTKYHSDDEYRKKYLDYQSKYKQKHGYKGCTTDIYRKMREEKDGKDWTCQYEECSNEIGYQKMKYCDEHSEYLKFSNYYNWTEKDKVEYRKRHNENYKKRMEKTKG